MPVPTLPPEIWAIVRTHLHRMQNVYINMEDGVDRVTFIETKGFIRGPAVFCILDPNPPELPRPSDHYVIGGPDNIWTSYFEFCMRQIGDSTFNDALTPEAERNNNRGTLIMKPEQTTGAWDEWVVVGRMQDHLVPRFHGHTLSKDFRAFDTMNAVIGSCTLLIGDTGGFPACFLTITNAPRSAPATTNNRELAAPADVCPFTRHHEALPPWQRTKRDIQLYLPSA